MKSLLSFFVFIFSFSLVQAERIKVQNYDGVLNSPRFSGSTGVMFGEFGIFQTSNNGYDWYDPVQLGIPDITAVEMNGDDIFFVGKNGFFLRSLDGGKHWSSTTIDATINFLNIRHFFGWLYVMGENGSLFSSSNNGETWSRVNTPSTSGNFLDISIRHYIDQRYMTVEGDENSNFWSYTQGFWEPGSVPMVDAKTGRMAKNSLNHVFILANNEELGQVVMEEIGGDWIWIILPQREGFVFKDICAGVSTFVLATKGDFTRIYRSDAQYTWYIWQEIQGECNSIAFNDEYVFVTQNVGGFVHRIPFNSVSIQQTSNSVPEQFSLSQNYPNPFNPTTNINFSIPKTGRVKLSAYDMLGREIKTLVNEVLSAGEYKYTFVGNDLTTGTYLYKLETENFVQTKKMMLIK